MKRNKTINKWLAVGTFLLAGGMTSCDDFLTVLPTDQITEEDFWKNKSDLDNARAGAYRHATSTSILEKVLMWGEFRSDNLTLNKTENTSILYLQDAILRPTEGMFNWATFYTGINYCNKVLERGQRMVDEDVDATLREGDWNPIKAEMKALRALEYFYLVRAFRDVPFITQSISTDAEAKEHLPAVTPGAEILGTLIEDLEGSLSYAALNFGAYRSQANYTRFTRRSIKALLADMYLWRGCMLKNIEAKGDTIINVNGDSIYTDAQAEPIIADCFTKAKQHCTDILSDMRTEYTAYLKENDMDEYKDGNYAPLVYNDRFSLNDMVYTSIFGDQYSAESILEWPNADGAGSFNNNTVPSYLSSYSNTGFQPQTMVGNSLLVAQREGVDADGTVKGFTRTDARMWSTLYYQGQSQMTYPILKFIAGFVSYEDWEALNEGYVSEPSFRNTSSNFIATWPVYRMSDVMLIKAEACARLNEDVQEGFNLTNALFVRNNPALDSTDAPEPLNKELLSDRIKKNFGSGKTADDLLGLVYRERQREFVAEGKRWFDLVRYAESTYSKQNGTKAMFDLMLSSSTTLQSRCRRLYSLYNPIYTEEMKVNGNLVQNPVWDKYTK